MRKVRRHAHFLFCFASPAHQLSNSLKTTKMSEKIKLWLSFPLQKRQVSFCCPFAVLAAGDCNYSPIHLHQPPQILYTATLVDTSSTLHT